jgi:crossover junction endodeoxyribonuclease RusA
MVPTVTSPISFAVRGLPIAKGVGRAFVAGGKARIATDANRTTTPLGAWIVALGDAARAAVGRQSALTGPVMVSAWFVFPRPAHHYLPANSRRPARELRLDAPRFVDRKPDVDKLARALLDALTNVVIEDDAQVAGLMAWKVYDDVARPAGCEVVVTPQAVTR